MKSVKIKNRQYKWRNLISVSEGKTVELLKNSSDVRLLGEENLFIFRLLQSLNIGLSRHKTATPDPLHFC